MFARHVFDRDSRLSLYIGILCLYNKVSCYSIITISLHFAIVYASITTVITCSRTLDLATTITAKRSQLSQEYKTHTGTVLGRHDLDL